ncbi:MAG: hypothetical protein IKV73_03330, partial [Clostridia bacterium]|nr:hypothetical protein [Clostridia bacterium]
GYNQHTDYLNGFYQMEQQKEALKIWNISAEKAMAHKLPSIGYTVDETREITDIKEIAEAELEASLCDIILGRKSIDEYDAVIEKAKANGYDRYLEITQTAYERFLAKAK